MQLRHTQFSEKLDERRSKTIIDKIIMLLLALDILIVALNIFNRRVQRASKTSYPLGAPPYTYITYDEITFVNPKLLQHKLLDSLHEAVIFDRIGNIIGTRFEFLCCIAHRNADSASFNQVYIIILVAYRQNFLFR